MSESNVTLICRVSRGEQPVGRVPGWVFHLCGEDQVVVDEGGAQVLDAPLPHLRARRRHRHHVWSRSVEENLQKTAQVSPKTFELNLNSPPAMKYFWLHLYVQDYFEKQTYSFFFENRLFAPF